MCVITSRAMHRCAAATYLADVCRLARNTTYAVLNQARVLGRLTLEEQRVTVSAQFHMTGKGKDGDGVWEYRVAQAF